MSTLNNVVLVGRLTAAPELRRTNSGTSVTSFTIALDNPSSKDQDKTTSFIPVNCWNVTAENVAKYCDKGDLIALEGRLNQRTYEDKEGNRRSIVEVVAQNIQFLTPKKDKEDLAEEEPEPPARTPAKNRAGYQQRR